MPEILEISIRQLPEREILWKVSTQRQTMVDEGQPGVRAWLACSGRVAHGGGLRPESPGRRRARLPTAVDTQVAASRSVKHEVARFYTNADAHIWLAPAFFWFVCFFGLRMHTQVHACVCVRAFDHPLY